MIQSVSAEYHVIIAGSVQSVPSNPYIDKLVDIAVYYGFDGWFLNIEVSFVLCFNRIAFTRQCSHSNLRSFVGVLISGTAGIPCRRSEDGGLCGSTHDSDAPSQAGEPRAMVGFPYMLPLDVSSPSPSLHGHCLR